MAKKKYKCFLFLFLIAFFTLVFHSFYYFEVYEREIPKKHINKKISTLVESKDKKREYVGILEIPKIKLKRGFYDLGFKENNVDKNIEVIETSVMPEEKYGNLILASHSGNSKISFFKNLYKLELGDIAYVYYVDKWYTYQLVNIYDVAKDGMVLIRRKSNQTNLTLITCDKNKKDTQNVYIFALVSDLEEFLQ